MKPKDLLDGLQKFGKERVMEMVKRPEGHSYASPYMFIDEAGTVEAPTLGSMMQAVNALQNANQLVGGGLASSLGDLQGLMNQQAQAGYVQYASTRTIQPRQGYQVAYDPSPFQGPWSR